MTTPRFSAVFRALVPRRQVVVPREALAAQPRPYQVWTIATSIAALAGIAVAWPQIVPAHAAMIVIAIVAGAAFVPIAPTPWGGFIVFLTPTFSTVGLLYDPASAFVGVTIGWAFGSTFFHRREPWRCLSNGFISGVTTAISAAIVGSLRGHLPLAAVSALAPVAVVATRHIANTMLITASAYTRWNLPPWPYFTNRVTTDIAEEALDVVWLLPIAAGSVVLARDQWWILLFASLVLSAINRPLTQIAHRRRTATQAGVADGLLPTDDERLRGITTQLSQGAALAGPDGQLHAMTPLGMSLFGVSTLAVETRLQDLCLVDDGPRIDELFGLAGRNWGLATGEVRVRSAVAPTRWVSLGVDNRLSDPAVRGFAVTIHEVTDEQRRWRALAQYADQAFAAPLVHALEEERRHVAREVDSSVRQTLAVLQLALDRPGLTRGVTPHDLVGQALRAARSVQRALAPPELDDLGLLAAIRTYCDELRNTGLEVDLDCALDDHLRLSRDIELVAYRAIQWALDNVVRHAGVAHATVSLSVSNGQLRISIADNGRGFRPDTVRTIGGLTQLEGRTRLVGGTVTVDSAEGKGTCVTVELPAIVASGADASGAGSDRGIGGGPPASGSAGL